ncbi:MAG: hypothetical protein U1F59_01235 [Candidatus Competibacteraceae bacterium]
MPKRDDEKPENEKRQREEELQDLWQRRDRLNESEWGRLHKLIYLTLSPSAKRGRISSLLKELKNHLDEDFDVYFQDFFARKVFLPARRAGFVARTLLHPGALHTYFRRFLLDRLDELERQPQAFELLEEENEERESILDILSSTQTHPDLPDPDWRPSPEQEWRLWNIGLDLPTVTASARDFFNQLTPEDQLLFKEGFAERKPLGDLREKIPNVYYAASRLGISENQNQFPDYCKTRIGQWLASLGLYLGRHDRDPRRPHDPDKMKEVFIVLQILRACALGGVDADRRSGSGTGPADPPQPDA